MTWSRYLLDQEWYNPQLSTIRGLTILGMYLAGRGFESVLPVRINTRPADRAPASTSGPCFMFVGLSMKLCEDFGLHLGIHRLSMGSGGIAEELITSRRDCFFATFSSDVCVESPLLLALKLAHLLNVQDCLAIYWPQALYSSS